MTFRKKTLRKMSPTTRKLARTLGDFNSVVRRLKNLVPVVGELEFQANALTSAKDETNSITKTIQYEPDVKVALAVLIELNNAIDGSKELQGGTDNIPISLVQTSLKSAIKLLKTPTTLAKIFEE